MSLFFIVGIQRRPSGKFILVGLGDVGSSKMFQENVTASNKQNLLQSNIEANEDLGIEIDDQSNDEERHSNSKLTKDTGLQTTSKIIIEATFESGLDQSFEAKPTDSKRKVEATTGDKVYLNKEVGLSSC